MIPIGSTPTTHILKLPLGRIGRMGIDMSRSVENEWLCSQIAQKLDIKTAHSKISTFDGIKVLVVERFDRVISSEGNWIIRLPQEDFCQITATPSERKYEADGGQAYEALWIYCLGQSTLSEIAGLLSNRKYFLVACGTRWACEKLQHILRGKRSFSTNANL